MGDGGDTDERQKRPLEVTPEEQHDAAKKTKTDNSELLQSGSSSGDDASSAAAGLLKLASQGEITNNSKNGGSTQILVEHSELLTNDMNTDEIVNLNSATSSSNLTPVEVGPLSPKEVKEAEASSIPAVNNSLSLTSNNNGDPLTNGTATEERVSISKTDFDKLQNLLTQLSRNPSMISAIPTGLALAQTSVKAINVLPAQPTLMTPPGGTNHETVSLASSTGPQVQNSSRERINSHSSNNWAPQHDRWNYTVGNDDTNTPRSSFYDSRMTVKLPEFSGKAEDYLAWKSRFQTTILPRQDPIQIKFMVLLDCTSKIDDLKHFKHWDGQGQDLEEAFKHMDNLYGNPTHILESMLTQLNACSRVYKEEQVKDLLKLQAQLDAVYTTARKLGRLELYRIRISEAVMTRLPRLYVDQICKEDKDDVPAVETIRRILQENLEVGLRAVRFVQTVPKPDQKFQKKPNRTVGFHHVNTSENNGDTRSQPPPPQHLGNCPFCQNNHEPKNCPYDHGKRMYQVRRKGLCLVCLRRGHIAAHCWSEIQCEKCDEGRHHESICFQQKRRRQTTQVGASAVAVTGPVYYKCLMLDIGYGTARAFADEGSGFNFVEEGLVKRLKIPTVEGPGLTALGLGRKSGQVHTKYIWLNVSGKQKISVRLLFCVIPKISYAKFLTPPSHIIDKLPSSAKQFYWDDDHRPVEIMIGLGDYGTLIDEHHRLCQEDSGDYSYQTGSLGTVIFGGPKRSDHVVPVHLTLCAEDLLKEDQQADKPDDDQFVEEFLNQHVRAVPGRIEVDVPMTGKYALASNSNRSLKQSMANYFRWQKKGLLPKVLSILQDWHRDGIIEPLPEQGTTDPRYHVLSYHTVMKLTSETTKIRLVFNGSLNDFLGRTLNDYLFKGHTTWSLVSSILEFRLGRYPLAGDIRQAFLMVQLAQRDRNMFCFYWPHAEAPTLFRFARVPFGTSSSPFLLYVALLKVIQLERTQHPELKDMIRRFYVDDLITSFDSKTDLSRLKSVCIEAFSKYGFNFGWSGESTSGVLGLDWDPVADTLTIRIPTLGIPNTVRDLARVIPSIFDPSGWLEPPISALRRCFSDAWKAVKDWDRPIAEDVLPDVTEVLEYLQSRSFTQPRWTGGSIHQTTVLHVFADANLASIGITVYALVPETDELRLIFAKSVLHRRRSVPEAELDALHLATKIIHKHFCPRRFVINLWTDSLANYHRLHSKTVNDLKYRQAVKVMKMRELLEPYQASIHHVAGTDNSADLMTKFDCKKFNWNSFMVRRVPQATYVHMVHSYSVQVIEPQQEHTEIVDALEQADTLDSLLDKYNLHSIIRAVQYQKWRKELHALINGMPMPSKSDLGYYYYLFDNEMLCTKLRTDPESVRIMIPPSSPLCFLLWKYEHLKRGHMGTDAMIKWYRSTYFTPTIRLLIKQWTYQCLYCAMTRRRPVAVPSAPLPRILRTTPPVAFTHCGLDFAGPYHTIQDTTEGPVQVKRYLLMVTCFHSRAVFTHLLESESAHALRCGLRLFVLRYQEPETMFSDNGKGIVKASKDIKALYALVPEATVGFRWTFCLPNDPATNGINEVMIGVTKKAVKGFNIPRCITEQELQVFIAEAEVVVNNRPLYVHDNEIITPNHFIYGRTTRPMIQPTRPSKDPSEHVHVQIRKRTRTYWNTWTSGYLERRRDLQQGRCVETLKIGDHVLYTEKKVDDNGQWPTGVVTQVYPGEDGLTRSAEIRMHNGEVLTRRTVRQLIKFSSSGAEAVASTPNKRK